MTLLRHFRCAIYTRVSSDQALEQDFNSLDAQREAAEAYIKSQAHEGWRLRRDRYDDGGFSGGSIVRPALQRLLADIAHQRLDVVVVYKVDRLTRSLADFAKLIELFDARKVSFVSVTQSFSTTTSMGRLTLNVLLSFAQFEREVTGERIRDKIAASKKKGIWMGGVVPLGYRVEKRRLLIDETEAETVRLIFKSYLDLGSLPALQRALLEKGVRSRCRMLSSGRFYGGVPFTNGPLSHLLRNRTYRGEINHKRRSFPGDHMPVIDADLFEAVQARLAENCNRSDMRNSATGALFIGRVTGADGRPMSPSYTTKKEVRYRYYVAADIVQGKQPAQDVVKRVPAIEIETIVMSALRKEIIGDFLLSLSDAQLVSAVDLKASIFKDEIGLTWVEGQQTLQAISGEASMDPDPEQGKGENRSTCRTLTLVYKLQPHRRRRDIIMPFKSQGTVQAIRHNEQQRLLRSLAKGRAYLQEMLRSDTIDIGAIAKRENKSERSIRAMLSLAFVDPKLVRAAIQGALPRRICAKRLIDLPFCWTDQWHALGLVPPP